MSVAIDVVINPIPVAVATNNDPICNGDDAVLTAGVVDGATYEWFDNTGALVSIDQVYTVSNLATTSTYELVVTLDGCSDNVMTTVVVNDNPIVTPTLNYTANADCSLGDIDLDAGATGTAPLTYVWTGPDGFSSTNGMVTIPDVTTAANGTYTVVVTDANGCTAEGVVSINNIPDPLTQPVVSSSGPSCEGGSITLMVDAYPGSVVTYEWFFNGGTLTLPDVTGVNTNQIVISPADAATHEGDYTVNINVDGCMISSNVYAVDVYEQPTAAPSYTMPDNCEGSTISLFANAGNISDPSTVTYSWTGPNGFASNAENPTISNVTFDANGTYTVVITNATGCATTATVEVNNILEAPLTPTIASNSPVCINEDIILTIIEQYTGGTVTYEWFNGAGIVIGAGSSVVIPASDALAISPYTVIVTVDGCETSLSIPHPVKVDPLPLAIATNNGPICVGDDVTLTAAEELLAIYEWRDVNGVVVATGANPVITGLTATATFELTVTSQNGCVSDPLGYTTVVVNPLPIIAGISGDGTYCQGEDVTLSGLNSETTGMTLVTYTWIGPNGFSYTDIALASGPFDVVLPNVDATDEGTYTLTITSDDGCIGTPVSVNVVVNDEPVTPNLFAEGDLCKGEDLLLTVLNPYNGASVIYEWYYDNTGFGFGTAVLIGSSNTPSFILYDVAAGASGDYYVQVTVDGCESSPSNATSVNITNPPMPIPSVVNAVICEGDDIALLANGMYDQYQWIGPNGFSSTEQNPLIENATAAASGMYELVITINDCISDMASVNVVVVPLPTTPTLTNNGPLCEGEDLILTVTDPVDDGNTTYTWYDAETNSVIATTTTPSYTIVNATENNAGGYYVVLSNSLGCESLFTDPNSGTAATEITNVTIFTVPVNAADAGVNFEVCGPDGVSLNAITPTVGTGQWTTTTGATIDNPNDPATTVQDLVTGDNIFVWTLSNGSCMDYDSDTVTVTVTAPATDAAYAGNDQVVCLSDGDVIALGGSAPTSPNVTGTWTQTLAQASLGITISDTNIPNPVIQGIPESTDGATYTFTWIYTNGACGDYSSDVVEITIYSIPGNGANAGVDIDVCGGDVASLNATAPSIGEGYWTSPSGATIANPDVANTQVLDLDEGENMFIWTLSNSVCGDYDTDTVLVNVTVPSDDIAYAGDNMSICGDVEIPDGILTLGGSVPTAPGVIGTWTQPDDQDNLGVVIVDPNDPNTDVTGIIGTPDGTEYTFTWTLNNGACGDFSSDEVSIIVYSVPTGLPFLGEDVYSCGSDTYELFANEVPGVSGSWSSNDPAITIITPDASSTIVTGLSVGENEFYYSISAGACSGFAQDTIIVNYELGPEAIEDNYMIEWNTNLEGFDVTLNDDFFGVSEWTITVLQDPIFGEVVDYGDGTFDYIPSDNFLGNDEFIYQICNANCPELCDTAMVIITVDDAGDCIIPTIFTPNADGVNDQFIVNCLDDYENNEIIVFNRWGDEVYRETGYSSTWEGTYEDQPLPEGTYFYIISLNDANDTVYQGFVMLKR